MLSTLRIKNLAIIADLEVDFTAGMNIITGETGAGKSILLRGLQLLLGGKASADLVRNGEERCEVEGLFTVPEGFAERVTEESMREIFSEDEITLRRIVDRSGKAKAYINGKLSSRAELEAVAQLLVDVTGQHQQGTLLDERYHREFLDRYGVSRKLRDEVAVRYREFSQGARQLAEFRGAASEKAEYFRRLTFERDELQSAAPRAGEKEELLGELARLASVEALTSISQNGIDLIEEPGAGLEAQFGRLLSLIETGVKKDRALGEVLELVRSAELQLREAKLSLSHYGANLEADPETLEALRERVAEIARLERKYGKAEEELVQYLSRISGELAQFESGAFDEEALQKKVDEARAKLRSVEAELTAERRAASERLTAGVLRELKEVSMKNASFVVSLGARESSPTGADEVSFLLSANPGQPPRELSKVASGGELSRILLVLKTALNDQANDQHGPPVQVFDEIDVGVGGAVAQAVGERIKKLSRLHQVILITHAPQIAALADTHLLVAKTTDKQSTVVGVRYLDAEGRTQEIARMLAGKKVTEKFEDSARELLGVGGKGRKKAANS